MELVEGSLGTISRPEGAELPRGWRELSFGVLEQAGKIVIRSGFAQGEHNAGGEGVPHLRPFNVAADGRVDLTQIKYVAAPTGERVPWVVRGDVIFNNTNSEDLVGKTAYFPLDGSYVLSNHMTLIRVLDRDSVDAYWLASRLHYEWIVGTFRSMLRRYVGQATVSLQRLKELVLPFPSIGEQRAIAETLRSERQAKETTEAVIAATRELKKSLMRHLFTYGPVPVQEAERVRLKETEIGTVPEHWAVSPLGDLAHISSGGTPDRKASEYWDGPVPWVTTSEVNYRVITSTKEGITELGFRNSAAKMVPAGTILMAMYGQGVTRGRVAILGIDATVNQACAAIQLSNDWISTDFIYHYLISAYEKVRNLAHGANQQNLNALLVKSILVLVPPVAEQTLIGQMLSVVDRKTEIEESRKQALEVLFNSLLHNLMTGKVRVKSQETEEG